MAADIFIDTSGFFALLSKRDERHEQAAAIMRAAARTKRRFATTDYVVDETATLLTARRLSHLVPVLFETVTASRACTLSWMGPDRFEKAKGLLLRNLTREWSFTDCSSFVAMKELRLREALTKDGHFTDAGFVALLA
jgi:uncharacterized protein